ncbi:MAG: hypothetical protein AAF747_10095 [Planctomycetota bacterium]
MTGEDQSSGLHSGDVLRHSLLCRGCEYDLLGLSRSSACPECGKPIVETLRGDYLQYADQAWLGTISRGISRHVLWPFALMLGLLLFGVGWAASNAAVGVRTYELAYQIAGTVVIVVGGGLLCATPVLLIWGWWRFTTPEPGRAEQQRSVQKRARVGLIVTAASTALYVVFEAVFSGALFQTFGGLGGLINFVIPGLCAVPHTWTAADYIDDLASRMPDGRLSTSARRSRIPVALLASVGTLACCVGPIVALVWHCALLDKCRANLKVIQSMQPVTSVKA